MKPLLFFILLLRSLSAYCQTGPVAICTKDTLVYYFNSLGAVEIKAKDFDRGSYDDKTPSEKLKFSFDREGKDTSKIFTCVEHIYQRNPCNRYSTEREKKLYVFDEDKNVDSCNIYIYFEDTLLVCPFIERYSQSINISIQNQFDFTGPVEANIYMNNKLLSTQILKTNNSLVHCYVPNCYIDSTFRVELMKNGEPLNGVTTADAISIKNHILGKQAFTSPYSILAADVNESKNLTAADVKEIRLLIIGNIDKFTKTSNWKFIDANYIFPNPSYPYDAPNYVEWIQKNENTKYINFIAIKMGDVNMTSR
jgi:hypothetical protein